MAFPSPIGLNSPSFFPRQETVRSFQTKVLNVAIVAILSISLAFSGIPKALHHVFNHGKEKIEGGEYFGGFGSSDGRLWRNPKKREVAFVIFTLAFEFCTRGFARIFDYSIHHIKSSLGISTNTTLPPEYVEIEGQGGPPPPYQE